MKTETIRCTAYSSNEANEDLLYALAKRAPVNVLEIKAAGPYEYEAIAIIEAS